MAAKPKSALRLRLFKMSLLGLILAGVVLDLVHCDTERTWTNVSDDFVSVAKKHGSTAVGHEVRTPDGYILTVFNVPGDRRKPLLMMHGVFDSSDGFIISGNDSLVMVAARAGYDVWALNFRGNRYSRKHETLDPDKDLKFWDYSSHEHGVWDLAATIDYVLGRTRQDALKLVGFSQGTTAALILLSTHPEYNDKVDCFAALAPVAYLYNVLLSLYHIINFSPVIDFFLPSSVQEVAGYNSFSKSIMNFMCTQLPMSYELCYEKGMNSVSGNDPDGIDRDFLKVIMAHFPAGTSRKNLMHFAQISLRRRFAQYDYGTTKNLNLYHTHTPPEYNVSRVTAATILVSGLNDPVSTMTDVDILKSHLPNVVKHIVVKDPEYNHLDHLWAKHARELEYEQIMDELAKC